jgi:hypothetical protein
MNDESVVFGLSQKTPRSAKRPTGCAAGVALIWPLGTLTGAAVGKLLPAPETIGLDAVFPAILLALVIPAFKNRTTLIRACQRRGAGACRRTVCAHGLPVLLSLFGLLSRKNNGQYDAVYRRYRHPVAGNLSDAPRRREARQSAGIFRALAGAAFRCGDGAAFSVALATTFYEGRILPAWRAFWAWLSPCSSPGARCR